MALGSAVSWRAKLIDPCSGSVFGDPQLNQGRGVRAKTGTIEKMQDAELKGWNAAGYIGMAGTMYTAVLIYWDNNSAETGLLTLVVSR